ncbi:phage tail sheath family protein [Pedobacter agri]|uniref:phage tail sheath family protein n=1 Tax=Pedobacter agri TaxID=454586 RepID=UPI00292F98BF|nr:phage tail sheath C-terminal domain-containing protein [Pedobacter agri]
MAQSYKHPGVYVEEISKIPPSIAQVETAIPGFIGYTAKREKNGIAFDVNIPQRITSLLEFEQYFGGAFPEVLEVTIENPENGSAIPKIVIAPADVLSGYLLYYHVKMFYENGGSSCFIVSVGTFTATPAFDKTELLNGLDACEKVDEITLLVIPEITTLTISSQIKELNDAMLAQCAKLRDRFAILDASQADLSTPVLVADIFRSDFISDINLKYGAVYYPQVQSGAIYNRVADENILISKDNRGGDYTGIYKSVGDIKKPITDITKPAAQASVAAYTKITIDATPTEKQSISIAGISLTFDTGGIAIDGTTTAIAKSLKDIIIAHNDLKLLIGAESSGKIVTITALKAGADGNNISVAYDPKGGAIAVKLDSSTLMGGFDSVDFQLFNQIKSALNAYTVPLYPSGMMAGVMARVDHDRGVWKAPANVNIKTVYKPLMAINDEQHNYLNIDPTGGKSINAIRRFTGRGTLVSGARTLAGNDNEWRYIPIRRLFIVVEESIKKATEFVVFEPNDSNTWVRVKAMCENFLNQLWRQGALAGAKPEHAYFVNVGLGVTMTSIDVLEGRLIIEIGMAATRPAEFIILKISHLLAKS